MTFYILTGLRRFAFSDEAFFSYNIKIRMIDILGIERRKNVILFRKSNLRLLRYRQTPKSSRWKVHLKMIPVAARSAAAHLLGLRVRISCECCVLLGRGLCYGTITLPEESYLVWYI